MALGKQVYKLFTMKHSFLSKIFLHCKMITSKPSFQRLEPLGLILLLIFTLFNNSQAHLTFFNLAGRPSDFPYIDNLVNFADSISWGVAIDLISLINMGN